jgi:hypothetical protein
MDSKFELGEINYEAANRLASEVVIPRLRLEVFPKKGSEPFRLRDEVFAILKDEVEKGNLTQEQLDTTFKNSAGDGNASLKAVTRWYVRNILKSSREIMLSDTPGYYFLTEAAANEVEENEDAEEGEVITGSIYAYTFPSLKGSMIKVGKASGSVEERINQQLGTANPEAPTILKVWSVGDIDAMEKAIHYILKVRGKWIDAPRAKEWFRTNVEDVEAIIKFVKEG